MDQRDLTSFFRLYDPESVGRTIEVVGENDPSQPGSEAMLDVQYGMAMAAGVKRSVFWVCLFCLRSLGVSLIVMFAC